MIDTPHSERDTLYFHSEPTPVPIFQREWEFARALELYDRQKPQRVLEVGTFHGGTLYHWMRHAALGATIVSVDSYRANVDNRHLYQEWAPRGLGLTIHAIEGNSRDPGIVAQVAALGPYDWIFIDADHLEMAVQADWDNYRPLAAPGAIVALHDIMPADVDWIQVAPVWRRIQAQGYLTQELVCADDLDWSGIGVVYL